MNPLIEIIINSLKPFSSTLNQALKIKIFLLHIIISKFYKYHTIKRFFPNKIIHHKNYLPIFSPTTFSLPYDSTLFLIR